MEASYDDDAWFEEWEATRLKKSMQSVGEILGDHELDYEDSDMTDLIETLTAEATELAIGYLEEANDDTDEAYWRMQGDLTIIQEQLKEDPNNKELLANEELQALAIEVLTSNTKKKEVKHHATHKQ